MNPLCGQFSNVGRMDGPEPLPMFKCPQFYRSTVGLEPGRRETGAAGVQWIEGGLEIVGE